MKLALLFLVLFAALSVDVRAQTPTVNRPDAEWKRILSPNAYLVLRKGGTETPYTGAYWDFHGDGIYACAGCGQNVFDSKSKFDSKTGWPSFFRELGHGRTIHRSDVSEGMTRTEVACARCGGHLGHVFDDGPKPTGLRYCMNSPALKFKARKSVKKP